MCILYAFTDYYSRLSVQHLTECGRILEIVCLRGDTMFIDIANSEIVAPNFEGVNRKFNLILSVFTDSRNDVPMFQVFCEGSGSKAAHVVQDLSSGSVSDIAKIFVKLSAEESNAYNTWYQGIDALLKLGNSYNYEM